MQVQNINNTREINAHPKFLCYRIIILKNGGPAAHLQARLQNAKNEFHIKQTCLTINFLVFLP